MGRDRGQVHTLEALVAALLLLTSVVFSLQMTAVTPLSASTSSQHIENQQQASAEGVLATAVENETLKRAILYWNDTRFVGSSTERFYTRNAPPNEFGKVLERQFGSRGIAYNVVLTYSIPSGDVREQRMVYRGAPSDNAVTSARTVVLLDDDRLYNESGRRPDTNLTQSYLGDDISPKSPVYTVVRVEVTVWRI